MPARARQGTGRAYLLTGVTGFLGKVLLEELLRRREELGVERVYVLIRPKGAFSAKDRFRREVASSECFSRLSPDWTDIVEVIAGTFDEPDLQLDADVQDEIKSGVTHIIHAAASVDFDLPLVDAARSNIATTLNLLEEARSCAHLEKFVSVSTAYATPHPGDGKPIEETLAPLPQPAEQIYRSILDGSADPRDLLARSGHPNNYTLTKCLAEHLLVERSGTVPVVIVRPSIISAAWRHPFPGWIDSAAGFAAFVVLLGMGRMRAVVGDPNARLDLIPVDVVATRILRACEAEASRNAASAIQHAVAGFHRSASVRDCWERVRDFYTVHRVDRRPTVRYMGPPGLRFALADRLHHRLAIGTAKLISRRARRSGGQLLARVTHLNNVFPYFTRNSFDFQSSQTLDDSFEPHSYVTTVCRGVHRHIFGRDDTEWLLAGRRHRGHGGDALWVSRRPHGSAIVRIAAWVLTKVLRRCTERVSVDIPSFEAARKATPDGSPIVIVPSHRSYLDFVLCSYLCFARPDLRVPIPYIAAAIEFGRIPILGRLLSALNAFYLKRGEGREDKELTKRVHELLRAGKTIEFFIEGTRSRSRQFLEPKRGLLRCLQATGETCTLLPVAISYDRVPEEAAFARELAGAPKPKMRLRPLLAWTLRTFRGQIDIGRIHIACGEPVTLGPESDVLAVSHEVIDRLEAATVCSTFHLCAFLNRHSIDGVDVTWLRKAIERRGGRVLESRLEPPEDLDPLITATLRHQFAHHFNGESPSDERLQSFLATVREPGVDIAIERESVLWTKASI